MIDSVPVSDTIEKDWFSYFKYIYTPLDADILIKLTAISGNPNIVVKYKSWDEFPTFDTADLISEEITSFETITISKSQLPKECTSSAYKNPCSLFIGVTSDEGYEASQFTIVAYWDVVSKITELLNGVP